MSGKNILNVYVSVLFDELGEMELFCCTCGCCGGLITDCCEVDGLCGGMRILGFCFCGKRGCLSL